MGRGALVFKGEKAKKKKKKTKHASNQEQQQPKEDVSLPSSSYEIIKSNNADFKSPSSSQVAEPQSSTTTTAPNICNGTGKIITSGTVVTGIGTKFTKELRVGDALLLSDISDRRSNSNESNDNNTVMRIVTMRLSDTALNLSSALPKDLMAPTGFRYVPKPRNMAQERAAAARLVAQTKQEETVHAFGRYNSSNSNNSSSAEQLVVYRTKTANGSYRVERESVQKKTGAELTRSDLLQLRSKKSSDKYC